jgi:hypothetical protein
MTADLMRFLCAVVKRESDPERQHYSAGLPALIG